MEDPTISKAARLGTYWEDDIDICDEEQEESAKFELDRLICLAYDHEITAVEALDRFGFRKFLTDRYAEEVEESLHDYDAKQAEKA